MSLQIKAAKSSQIQQVRGGQQQFLGGFIKGIAKIGGGIIKGIGQATGIIPQAPAPVPMPQAPRIAPQDRGGFSLPFPGQDRIRVLPGAALPGGDPLFQRERPAPRAGTTLACPSGFHPNKTSYFLKNGTFVPEGSKCVKNRRRNALNPRAASRAISRLESAKKAVSRLDRISIKCKRCRLVNCKCR